MAMTIEIEIHSKAGCPHCDTAKAYLAERRIPYTEHRHDNDAERQAFYDSLGLIGTARTVPQVIAWITYADGEREMLRIGGARELQASGLDSLFYQAGTAP